MRNLVSLRWRSVLLVTACLVVLLPLSQARPAAVSPDVVISQVYGAGGNGGAIYQNDFVELYNRGTAPVVLNGKSIQYASATGTGNFGATATQLVALSGTIQPGAYYLVRLASGGSAGAPIPAYDATGGINMSGTAGKVALVNSTTSLGCNGGSAPCNASQLALIVDLVGYGGANFFEGSAPAPPASTITAVLRINGGATDTDQNGADFTSGAPMPRSSTSIPPSGTGAANPPSVAVGETSLLTVAVKPGDLPPSTGLQVSVNLSAIGGSASQPMYDDGTNGDATPADNLFSYLATPAAGTTAGFKTLTATIVDAQARSARTSIRLAVGAVPLAIHDIQGPGDASPYAGGFVSTTGIVTAIKTKGSRGFFLQAPAAQADGDDRTSEGVFVYTGGMPPADAAVGNMVQVVGAVQEYVPSADPGSLPLTEISGSPLVFALSSGNALPEPVVLGPADVSPVEPGRLERYEGMRVRADLRVVEPTGGSKNEASATATSNGFFIGVLPNVQRPFREPGIDVTGAWPADAPPATPTFDGNPERLSVNSAPRTDSTPIDVSTGALVSGLVGPLDFGSRLYTIALDGTEAPTVVPGIAEAIPVPAPLPGQFTVASFNMERFYDTADDKGTGDAVLTADAFAARLNKASLAIRHVLRTPDVLGVAEVENLATLQAIADKVNADAVADGEPDPHYAARLEEGNDIGGIDVGFLVKLGDPRERRLEIVDVAQVGKDATFVEPDGATATLNDRPPLVLRVTVRDSRGGGEPFPLTVIVNHLRSLSGIDDAADGPRVRAKRLAQAEFLAAEVQARQAAGEHVVLVGDFNAFQFNDGYVDVMGTITGQPAPPSQVLLAGRDLVQPKLVDLIDHLPPGERYSYIMDGNAQVLDHIVVTSDLVARTRLAIAHGDADFPEVYRNDPTRPERLSDHDALVAYFSFPPVRWGGSWETATPVRAGK